MKEYPHIPGVKKVEWGAPCFAFKKYDGSNLRWEWTRKRGWYEFGTRQHLFDKTDTTFGCAIDIFMDQFSELLTKIIIDDKNLRNREKIIAFIVNTPPSENLKMFWVNRDAGGILTKALPEISCTVYNVLVDYFRHLFSFMLILSSYL